MGWASGSELLGEVIGAVMANVPDKKARARIYERVLSAFESHDCGTTEECIGTDPVFDKILEKRQ